MHATAIVLFQDDFRINDNPALHHACLKYRDIILLYVHNDNYLGRKLGGASKIFLHKVLESFSDLLMKRYQTKLIVRTGKKVDILQDLVKETGAVAIYFNRSYTSKEIDDEVTISKTFVNLDIQSFNGKLIFQPHEIRTSLKENFKIFTPFSKECLKNLHLIDDIFPCPISIKSNHHLPSMKIQDLNLLPRNEGLWWQDLLQNWEFDYDRISENFHNFVENKVVFYSEKRNNAWENYNANISPYLRFGILSAKACFNIVAIKLGTYENQFNLELLWREFAYHTMYNNQNIATEELREEYANFKWEYNETFLKKWQNGKTGFDIVDAGMIQLWKTGVMHNRVRMIVASFLIKDLVINWRLGEEWFWNCLVDADPAINPFSWQWVFGSGYDGAPYFRVFNPDLQKERFDEKGEYCRKWLGDFYNVSKIISHNMQRHIILEKYKLLLKK